MGAKSRQSNTRCNTWLEESGFLMALAGLLLFCMAMGPIGNWVLEWLTAP